MVDEGRVSWDGDGDGDTGSESWMDGWRDRRMIRYDR